MLFIVLTVIAIIVGGYLAISALYDGGDSLQEQTARTQANQMINGSSQIETANIQYQLENAGNYAADVAELVSDGYLKSAPQMPSNVVAPVLGGTSDGTITITGVSDSQCEATNQIAGYGEDTILTDTASVTESFGCHVEEIPTDSDNPNAFVWKS